MSASAIPTPPYKFLVQKKPVKVWVMHFAGGEESALPIINWILENGKVASWNEATDDKVAGLYITTLEGEMHASPNDWIIQGVKGEFYPCEDSIFKLTYEGAK